MLSLIMLSAELILTVAVIEIVALEDSSATIFSITPFPASSSFVTPGLIITFSNELPVSASSLQSAKIKVFFTEVVSLFLRAILTSFF